MTVLIAPTVSLYDFLLVAQKLYVDITLVFEILALLFHT